MGRTRRVGSEHSYLLHCVPGLEGVLAGELMARVPGAQVLRTFDRFDERTSILLARTVSEPVSLLDLRTAEDVFMLAAEAHGVPPTAAGLAVIRAALGRDKRLETAVRAVLAVRRRGKGRGPITFRVISRVSGQHAFRRVDVQRAVEAVVAERIRPSRLVEDDAQVELWSSLVGDRLLLGARLSDAAMRHRSYLVESRPAALKPTVAAALALLSEPHPDDVVLDPMCGSGTILIERAEVGRYALLLGGDSESGAVEATRRNVGPKYKPIEIRQWDARSLPLEDGSVSALLCNLPFGKQIGTPEEIRGLYPALLHEFTRVVRPGGRMVLLAGERRTLSPALKQAKELVVVKTVPVVVRGFAASIVVVRRG